MNGFVVMDTKSCPAAGCKVMCTSYESGQVLLERKFRRVKVTQFPGHNIRIEADSSFGNVDIFISLQGAFCEFGT